MIINNTILLNLFGFEILHSYWILDDIIFLSNENVAKLPTQHHKFALVAD